MATSASTSSRSLAAAQAGAGWAAERLWRALAPAVAGYLRGQGAAEPDDLASEVFVGVLRTHGPFTGSETQFRSWGFTIAHRRLLDERRRAARRPWSASSGAEHGEGATAASAELQALARLDSARVRIACQALAPDQRDVRVLRLVAGLT